MRPWSRLSVRIGLAVVLSIAATGLVVFIRGSDALSDHHDEEFQERVALAARQIDERLLMFKELLSTGALVLARQRGVAEALQAGDADAVLRAAATLTDPAIPHVPGLGRQGIALYGLDGRLVLRVHSPLDRREAAPNALVQRALERSEPASGLRDDEMFGPSVAGAAPVLDDRGNVVGALEIIASLDDDFAAETAAFVGLDVAVLDTEQTVAASNSSPLAGPADLLALRAALGPAWVHVGEHDYLAESVALIAADGTEVGEVYVGIDDGTVVASHERARGEMLRAVMLALGFGLGAAAVVGVAVTRPFDELVRAARRIRENDLDTPVRARGSRELRELGLALDEMRLSVRETREDLLRMNARVASRAEASAASLMAATEELSVLTSVVADLAGDAAGGLGHVAEALTRLEWVDGAFIALVDGAGHLGLVADEGLLHGAASATIALLDAHPPLLVAGVDAEDTREAERFASLAALGAKGIAVVPMEAPGGVAGIVGVASTGRMELTPSRRELLRTVAHEVAAAIERNELAEEVGEQRRLAESVLRNMSDGIVVLDGHNRCRVCNPAAARMLGVDRRDVLGREGRAWLPLPASVLETLRQRTQRRPEQPAAPLVVDLAGRELAISAGPFVDRGAAESGLILLVRDLSGYAEADRLKQDFVSMVGHELRTPLTLIRTSIDLLADDSGPLTPTQRRLTEVLSTNSERLLRLINDLLDMSALDSGQVQVRPVVMNLVDCLQAAIAAERDHADAKGIALTLDAPPELPTWADRARIEQVLGNLVNNAVKYTPGGGHVVVRARSHGAGVEVRVQDDGIGIPPEEQQALFQKFYRTHSGRRQSGGTGLGLAIARSIVELHGGEIRCESDGASGTTFTFTLPSGPPAEGAARSLA